jgi:6-phosphogluconolactonase
MSEQSWLVFPSSEALAEALARDVADRLRAGIKARGGASLAVSGGSTPGKFFDALSRHQLDWSNVVVTLVDERFVPPSSDRSNERLVRERLLVNEARLARFVPLFSETTSVEEAARLAEAGIALAPKPLDVVVLGMGTDAHTASFFPDAECLAKLLNPASPRRVLPVEAQSAGEPRLTLTLATLADARKLVVHIEGTQKRDVLEQALVTGGDKPISAVLAASLSPVDIYWTQ